MGRRIQLMMRFRLNPLSFVRGQNLIFQYRRKLNILRLTGPLWRALRKCYELPTLAPKASLPPNVDLPGLIALGLLLPEDRVELFLRRERKVLWWEDDTCIHYLLAAHASGATVWFEHTGQRPILMVRWGTGPTLSGGTLTTYDGFSFAFERFGPVTLSQSKAATHTVLRALRCNVPCQIAIDRSKIPNKWTRRNARLLLVELLCDRPQNFDFPAVVKPGNGSLGMGVTFVQSLEDLAKALVRLAGRFRDAPYFVIETQLRGKEWRLTVLADGTYAAYRRDKLTVVGDGVSHIRHLINSQKRVRRQFMRKRNYVRLLPSFRIGSDVRKLLASRSLSLDSVLPRHRRLVVASRANVAQGASFRDATRHVAPGLVEQLQHVRSAMNLGRAGFDVVGDKLDSSIQILEVNGRPHMWPHLEPDIGEPQPLAASMLTMARARPVEPETARRMFDACQGQRAAHCRR